MKWIIALFLPTLVVYLLFVLIVSFASLEWQVDFTTWPEPVRAIYIILALGLTTMFILAATED